jgi:hypothetical protein
MESDRLVQERERGTWSSSTRPSREREAADASKWKQIAGGHIIDRFEGQIAWPSCMYVFEILSKEKTSKPPSIEDGARKYK